MNKRKIFLACKILSAGLCISTLMCSLSACNGEVNQSITESDTTAAESFSLPLSIAANGKAMYSIVVSQDVPEALGKMAVELCSVLEQQSGAKFTVSDDFVRPDADTSAAKEILIGITSRKESLDVMNEIGYFDGAVRVCGSKIVIAAHTEDSMRQLLDTFANELLKYDDGATLENEYTYTSDKHALLGKKDALEQYRIVYPNGNKELKAQADKLAALMNKNFGIRPSVTSDSTAESECEILLGATSRASVAEHYTNDIYGGTVKAVGKKILVFGGGEYFSQAVCDYFASKYVSTGFSDRFDISASLNDEFSIDPDSVMLEGADIRVMTYNILSKELSPDKAEFSERRALVSATMKNYLPDVIGIQEADAGAYSMLAEDLGDIYAFGADTVPEGKSYTSLMYNKNTVRLIESKNVQYSVGQKRLRLVSWGYFEHIATGKKFVVASMHWNVTSTEGEREVHARESVSLINELRARYNCPIMTTGDFNCNESTTYYREYLNSTNQKEAAFNADKAAYSEKNIIDHITYTNDASALFFKLLKTSLTAVASDHNPSFADFKLS